MSVLSDIKPVICIAGPTASGKSALAIEMAKLCKGEIINADSMQVYRDLQVLSARPTLEEMEGIPHHLFGHVDGAQRYSVGEWARDAIPCIIDCLARGHQPIVVGGTGLYFKALTDGLASVPEPTDQAKVEAQDLLTKGITVLRAKAEALDPIATARVLGDDPQRLSRIVSVALGTDKPLSAWQKQTRPLIPPGFWCGVLIMPQREKLYEIINDRYSDMVAAGGLDEAQSIRVRNLPADLPVRKAIGLQPLLEYLQGRISYDTALFEAKRDTRRFAKRQFTWFRGQTEGWLCVEDAAQGGLEGKILRKLGIDTTD